jgi:hypothetical protein
MPLQSNRIRHFMNYHNPKVMEHDFTSVNTFGILTNKRVRDLPGDIVWMIGRKDSSAAYWLYGRFRVNHAGLTDDSFFRYEVQGVDGYWFRPPMRLDTESWFPELLKCTANFSTGFQSIKDDILVKGLQSCHTRHKNAANSAVTSASSQRVHD